jgi:hypothetical protein
MGPAPANGQGQSQGHRRRRRRRKNKATQPGAPQAQQQTQAQPPQAQQTQPPPQTQASQQPKPQQHLRPGRKKKKKFFQQGGGGQGPQPGNSIAQPGNGNGHGRRKDRQRGPRTFVGPMDHSYRTVNGNVADSPPSTIEFRGNGQNGFYAAPPPPESVPTAIREDAPIRIYCFIEDLFFLAKIQETARKLGVKVGFVKADKDIVARLADAPEAERPSLIVFDLNNVGAKPLTLIPRLKSKMKRGTSVIGFLNHLQGDLKAKAVEAGCDMVMPRSAFSQNLPSLLRRHGLDEEREPVEA